MEYTINANKADGTYVPLFKFENENAAIEHRTLRSRGHVWVRHHI